MTTKNYKWMKLATIKKYEKLAAARGVSEVARSARGFLTAYKRAGGDWRKLPEKWVAKRNAFVARHLAQLKARPKFETTGRYSGTPTRQHLALIMWAYTTGLRGAPRENPVHLDKHPDLFEKDSTHMSFSEEELDDMAIAGETSADKIVAIIDSPRIDEAKTEEWCQIVLGWAAGNSGPNNKAVADEVLEEYKSRLDKLARHIENIQDEIVSSYDKLEGDEESYMLESEGLDDDESLAEELVTVGEDDSLDNIDTWALFDKRYTLNKLFGSLGKNNNIHVKTEDTEALVAELRPLVKALDEDTVEYTRGDLVSAIETAISKKYLDADHGPFRVGFEYEVNAWVDTDHVISLAKDTVADKIDPRIALTKSTVQTSREKAEEQIRSYPHSYVPQDFAVHFFDDLVLELRDLSLREKTAKYVAEQIFDLEDSRKESERSYAPEWNDDLRNTVSGVVSFDIDWTAVRAELELPATGPVASPGPDMSEDPVFAGLDDNTSTAYAAEALRWLVRNEATKIPVKVFRTQPFGRSGWGQYVLAMCSGKDVTKEDIIKHSKVSRKYEDILFTRAETTVEKWTRYTDLQRLFPDHKANPPYVLIRHVPKQWAEQYMQGIETDTYTAHPYVAGDITLAWVRFSPRLWDGQSVFWVDEVQSDLPKPYGSVAEEDAMRAFIVWARKHGAKTIILPNSRIANRWYGRAGGPQKLYESLAKEFKFEETNLEQAAQFETIVKNKLDGSSDTSELRLYRLNPSRPPRR